MPDALRQHYCQLWCALALGDAPTAVLAATAMGGEAAGKLLPEVLRPRDWRGAGAEERARVRREAGIGSFADLSRALGAAPRPLLDSLRLSAVVRHSAALLGATLRCAAAWGHFVCVWGGCGGGGVHASGAGS